MNYESESFLPSGKSWSRDNLDLDRVLEHRLGSWIKQMNDSKNYDFLMNSDDCSEHGSV